MYGHDRMSEDFNGVIIERVRTACPARFTGGHDPHSLDYKQTQITPKNPEKIFFKIFSFFC